MPRLADTTYDRGISSLYHKKYSASEVANKLRIPLHKVYDSLIRQKIPRRDITVQHQIRFERTPLSFKFREKFTRRQRELLVAGIMLYFGEGAKTGTTVDFTNSDLLMLKIFLRFLREICGINEKRLRLYLYCFTDQSPNKLISFWSRNLRVSRGHFTRPYVRRVVKTNQRVMKNGVLHIRYSDKRLLQKILLATSKISHSLI